MVFPKFPKSKLFRFDVKIPEFDFRVMGGQKQASKLTSSKSVSTALEFFIDIWMKKKQSQTE